MKGVFKSSDPAVFRFTALWAVTESGLGGFMHAMKIPFTGIVCGGFAVMIICLLASYSHQPFKTIIQSTLLVIAMKAAVSPHSPPAAYLAVAFQGFTGAILVGLTMANKLMVLLFSILAMLESAAQKIITMTILMGKELFIAFDAFAADVMKIFGFPEGAPYSLWMIGLYGGIYLIWGIILGWYTAILPSKLNQASEEEINELKRFVNEYHSQITQVKRKSRGRFFGYIFLLLFVSLTFIIQSPSLGWQKALYVMIRSLGIVLFYLYVLSPLFHYLIKRYSRKQQSKGAFRETLEVLPAINSLLMPAWAAAKRSGRPGRFFRFPLNLLLLSLHYHGEDHRILQEHSQR